MLYILVVLSVAVIMLLITAVANWKLPKERAKKWETVGTIIFTLGNLGFIGILNINMARGGPPLLTEASLPILIAIWLSLCPLLFFASAYIQYLKNKEDIETLRRTVRYAAVMHFSVIALAILSILFIV